MLLFFTDAERPGLNTPMRRSRRQSCQKHGARLDPASFGRAAAVVRNGGRVPDQVDLKPRSLKGADGGLAARPRPLHDDVDLTHAVILSSLGHLLRRDLRREWGGLAGPLEPHVAPAGPGEDVAAPVADAENRIVEGGVDVGHPITDILLFTLFALTDRSFGHARFASSKNLPVFSISVVTKITQLTARQIRYYEEKKLFTPKRTEGNTRLFSFNDIDKLLTIKDLLTKGFSLKAIDEIINKKTVSAETTQIRQIIHNDIFAGPSGLPRERSIGRGDLSRFYSKKNNKF